MNGNNDDLSFDGNEYDGQKNDLVEEEMEIQHQEYNKPLVILGMSDIINDHKKFKSLADECFNGLNVNKIKITANKNMLIYCGDSDTYETLRMKERVFENKKIIELKPRDSEFIAVIKGINYENLKVHIEELNKNGVIDIKEIKSFRPNKIINKVKLICENPDTVYKLLSYGIKLSYLVYKVEEFKQVPRITQCFRCQNFGHIAKNCKNEKQICPRCGKNDHELDDNNKPICKETVRFCVNCNGDHSSAYAKCPKKTERINKANEQISRSNSGYKKTVNHAEVLKNTLISHKSQDLEKSIIGKIDRLTTICTNNSEQIQLSNENYENMFNSLKTINLNIEEIKRSIENNENEIKCIKLKFAEHQKNNEAQYQNLKTYCQKICERFIDFYYICNPKQNYDEATIKSLKNFTNDLGLKKDENYIKDKLRRVNNNPNPQTQQSLNPSNQRRLSTANNSSKN
jgi:hypothetical protein